MHETCIIHLAFLHKIDTMEEEYLCLIESVGQKLSMMITFAGQTENKCVKALFCVKMTSQLKQKQKTHEKKHK